MNTWIMLLWGIFFFGIGQGIFMLIDRRRFYRRNESGVEEFENYTSAFLNHSLEKILAIIGGISRFIGVVFFLAAIIYYIIKS